MSVTQTITNTRLSGTHTFPLNPTADLWTNADLTIDRTVNGGLNSLTTADTLTLEFDYSLDGGTTWVPFAAITCLGGTLTTKGVTQTTEELTISSGVQPFPVGTGFQVSTTASKAVRVAGTVVYS